RPAGRKPARRPFLSACTGAAIVRGREPREHARSDVQRGKPGIARVAAAMIVNVVRADRARFMLRLLSLNLNYRVAKHGTWAERCARIVETVERHAVDVMALQAVEGEGRWNQAQELAERLDFGHVAFVAATQDRGVRRGSAFI